MDFIINYDEWMLQEQIIAEAILFLEEEGEKYYDEFKKYMLDTYNIVLEYDLYESLFEDNNQIPNKAGNDNKIPDQPTTGQKIKKHFKKHWKKYAGAAALGAAAPVIAGGVMHHKFSKDSKDFRADPEKALNKMKKKIK